jgi:hypothetical protein|tara:strand:+ start:2796 stop:3059 length:264 start_codon:yes stop_codon:yes gene_type:complete
MYINIYLVFSAILLFTILIYIIVNLYKKNSTYENWVYELNESLSDVLRNWNAIDSKQMFEKDDEVGVVYEGIDDIMKDIETRTTKNG